MPRKKTRTRHARVREAPAEYVRSSDRLLVDTHVWLWWRALDSRLGSDARAAIENAHEVRFSAASAWEIAIKLARGRLELPGNPDLAVELERDGFVPLPISLEHAVASAHLPPLHRDPFDRILVAQARIEGLTLVTADPMMSRYDVPILTAT